MTRSKTLFNRAKNYMPGGVNSPVRAFKSVGLDPFVVKDAKGAKLRDVDENEYIDYVCSWGPLILGHAHPAIIEAIHKAADRGTSYGATCEQEMELAGMICDAIPSVEMVRMVNSGTEATMSAVRLARAYTGRDKIVKFEGCYHGHGDSFLIKAGSGLLTAGVPTSPGVPGIIAEQTLIARYNDTAGIIELFQQKGSEIAAVIVEPVAGNMGLVPPRNGFLEELRKLTDEHGALLIFDEVITGFRLCFGGYQDMVDVFPDLTTLGKIIGGGLPVGAYGGRKDVMERIAPAGDVYQAGTLAGNPLAMASGIATLKELKQPDCYEKLERGGFMLVEQIQDSIKKHGAPCTLNRLGSMFSLFFTAEEVTGYDAVMGCDTELFARFYAGLLEQGVFFPPSQFETCFVSCAHEIADLERTAVAIDTVLEKRV